MRNKLIVRIVFLVLFFAVTIAGVHALSLAEEFETIAAGAHGQVSVACAFPGASSCSYLHPRAHAPMQSIFKLPLALTILHQVEEKKFTLDQPIRFRRSDRFVPHAVSALQDEFPNADVDVPLQKLLQLSVSQSDNAAADILLRLAGGPIAVQKYIASLGVCGFHLIDSEHALHRDESLQYRNYFEPAGAVDLLRRLSEDSPLTPQDTRLLLGWMSLPSATNFLQRDLPAGVIVAHKSGSSGLSNGLAAATNDIGLIPMPNGRYIAVAVFIGNSTADDATRAQIISRIARIIYEAALQARPPAIENAQPTFTK